MRRLASGDGRSSRWCCDMVQCRVIFALILVQVCDGGYGRNVTKKWVVRNSARGESAGGTAAHPSAPLRAGFLEKREKWGTRFFLSANTYPRSARLTARRCEPPAIGKPPAGLFLRPTSTLWQFGGGPYISQLRTRQREPRLAALINHAQHFVASID